MDMKNGSLMFILCAIVITYVSGQAIFFIRKAWKRGKEIGITNEKLKKVVVNSILVSIFPSLPIIISLFVLMPGLGRYFPWLRLSILGSAVYETMVASQTATSFGLTGIADPGFTGDIFISAMWVMTVSIMSGLIFDVLFLGKIDKKMKSSKKGKYADMMPIVLSALFPALLAVFITPEILNFGNIRGIVAIITSAVAVLLLSILAKKTGKKVITEFALPIGMVSGMASAILLNALSI